jgi:hypothetical protein
VVAVWLTSGDEAGPVREDFGNMRLVKSIVHGKQRQKLRPSTGPEVMFVKTGHEKRGDESRLLPLSI